MGFRDKFMAKSPFKVGEMKAPIKAGNMKSPVNEGKTSSMSKVGKMDPMANMGNSMAKKVDPYAEALKKDSKLPEYIKQRKGLKKGTAEYAKVQNKINKAYGVSKRHSEKPASTTTTKPAGPGTGDKEIKLKPTPGGEKKVTPNKPAVEVTAKKDKNKRRTVEKKDGVKTVTIRDRKGNVKKTKTKTSRKLRKLKDKKTEDALNLAGS